MAEGKAEAMALGQRPAEWVDVCGLEELPASRGKFVQVGRWQLAVFRITGKDGTQSVRVIDDACPHAGASLSSGWVEDGCVTCPWHAWCFALEDGRMPESPTVRVPVFDVRVEKGRVLVDVSGPRGVAPKEPRGE